ncbi:DUF7344 domain-containing protein [Halorussus pelagicus]|uniref:DUF7344 domain-containing protein n=1 Tax=Halorussus pelagicus TaxID=2505977 RepID=UPI000FFC54EA|nr:hypothetical protein [Halorussus pelagicus]
MNDDPDLMDRSLALLASEERRKVIEYFDRNDTESASVEALMEYLVRTKVETDGGAPSTSKPKAELHHVHLPKLAEYGVVEYDARSGEVRYCPDEKLEAIVGFVSEL